MKKIIVLVITAAFLTLSLISCNDSPSPSASSDKAAVNLGALTGSTAIGMAKLLSDNEAQAAANDYEFTLATTADALVAGLANGSLDIVSLPANVAAVLYNNVNVDVTMLAANVSNVLYIVEKGYTVNSINDLAGKTIYTTGKGTTPEYILRYALSAAGIEDSVTIEYKSNSQEVGSLLASDSSGVTVAMLPQPYAAAAMLQNTALRVALDMGELFGGSGAEVVTGVVIVRSAFLSEHKDAVDAFLTEAAASVAYMKDTENLDAAAALVVNLSFIASAGAAKAALPYCGLQFLTGNDLKTKATSYYSILYGFSAASVGGTIPADDFYYQG